MYQLAIPDQSTAANRGKAQVVPLAGGIIRLQPLEKVAVGHWCRAPSFGNPFISCQGHQHHFLSLSGTRTPFGI